MITIIEKSIESVSNDQKEALLKHVTHVPFGDIALDWCDYIRESAKNNVDIRVLMIKQGDRFAGFGILRIISNVDISIEFPKILKRLWKILRLNRVSFLKFHFGFFDIPIMQRSGLLLSEKLNHKEKDEIVNQIICYTRRYKKKLHALFFNFDASTVSAEVLKKNKLVFFQANVRTYFDYPYCSFQEYYDSLSSKKRLDIRRKKKIFENYNGEIVVCDTPDVVAPEAYKLFKNTLDQVGGNTGPIELSEQFFVKYQLLRKAKPKIFLAKKKSEIVAFLYVFQSMNTLYIKFVGMTYPISRKMFAYFNLYYAAMEYASQSHLTTIDCGITVNEFKKKSLNCHIIPSNYWIDFYHPFFIIIKWLKTIIRNIQEWFQAHL